VAEPREIAARALKSSPNPRAPPVASPARLGETIAANARVAGIAYAMTEPTHDHHSKVFIGNDVPERRCSLKTHNHEYIILF
jgi:hypothetical protein